MLSMFSGRQLQDCRALLELLADQGHTSIASAITAINAVTARPSAPPDPPRPPRPCPTIRPDGTPCPGRLQPAHNRDGLRIVGCRVCRYSEVLP